MEITTRTYKDMYYVRIGRLVWMACRRVDLPSRALSGRLEFTVSRQKFNKNPFIAMNESSPLVSSPFNQQPDVNYILVLEKVDFP